MIRFFVCLFVAVGGWFRMCGVYDGLVCLYDDGVFYELAVERSSAIAGKGKGIAA